LGTSGFVALGGGGKEKGAEKKDFLPKGGPQES